MSAKAPPHDHHILKCCKCDQILMQCRCIEEKPTVYTIEPCGSCKMKDGETPEAIISSGSLGPFDPSQLPPGEIKFVPHSDPKPHTCPICEGRGTVHGEFYEAQMTTAGTARVACRSCGGKGWVVV